MNNELKERIELLDRECEAIETELDYEDADDVPTLCYIEDVYIPRRQYEDDVAECHVCDIAKRLDNNHIVKLTEKQMSKVEEDFWSNL